MGDGFMSERIGEWKCGYEGLEEEYGVLDKRGIRRGEFKRGE